jgi:nickel-dependent lactate racemase
MSLLYAREWLAGEFTEAALREGLFEALEKLGSRKRVLIIPPDFTRFHSRAGILAQAAYEYYGDRVAAVLPALGTHRAMSDAEMAAMFGRIPRELFHVHDWRNGLTVLGDVPAALIRELSEDKLDFSWPVRVNSLLAEGGFDLILSLGQVVPHEVAGMAGHSKNIFIGTGGFENIDRSHYLGAVFGMERIMGRADNPVRRVLNYAAANLTNHLPIVHALTVIGQDAGGLFVGDDLECFEEACRLSLRLNLTLLDRPIRKAVVYLNPEEFHSTWLGNKAIYRLRMAMADGGELMVLAPGVSRFGEDHSVDLLIRKYGYVGTPAILRAVAEHADLGTQLSAAAHLIHGSSEGRFTITYCPGDLSEKEIRGVGFQYAPLYEMLERYRPFELTDGYNRHRGEDVFFVSNPALGLWADRERFSLGQGEAMEDPAVCGLAHLS